jgi:MFS superfamily sulfate permease-like transporter
MTSSRQITLALSLDSEVDTNKELIAHGYSNFLAGLFGTVPNYLVYVNTLLCVTYPSSYERLYL